MNVHSIQSIVNDNVSNLQRQHEQQQRRQRTRRRLRRRWQHNNNKNERKHDGNESILVNTKHESMKQFTRLILYYVILYVLTHQYYNNHRVSAMASNIDDDYGIVNDHVIPFTTIVPTTTTTTTTILMTTSSTSAIMNIEHDNHLPFKHNGTQNNKSERQQQQQQQQEGIESNMTSKNRTELKPDPEYVYFRTTARFWVQRVLVPTIMVIGTVGNVITIMIMTRRRMRSSTNWYLAALAIFDLIYLIFTLILSWKHYPNAHDVDYYLYWYMFPFSMMIADASSNTSVWLTATFTIERYIAVCHPIKGKVICTESRAKKIIFCVVLICVSVTIPTPFEWVVVEVTDTKTNQIRMEAKFSDFGENETYRSIYYQLNVFLFVLLPLVLLVIFNTFLIRSVHQSNQMRTKMVMAKDSPYQPSKNDSTMASSPSSSRQETRITIMLIAVVILFILCQTPNACIMVYNTFPQSEHNPNEEYLLTGLSNIGNFLMALNAAGNFILYCLLSQKYRRTFVNMFCPCLASKYLRSQSTYPRVYDSMAGQQTSHHHQQHLLRSQQSTLHQHRFGEVTSQRNGQQQHQQQHQHQPNQSISSSSISGNITGGDNNDHQNDNQNRHHRQSSSSSSSSSIKLNNSKNDDVDPLPIDSNEQMTNVNHHLNVNNNLIQEQQPKTMNPVSTSIEN